MPYEQANNGYMLLLSCFSHVRLFVTLWTVARQAPLSMGFSRQEYWSGLPFSPPGDLPDPRIELVSLTSPGLAGRFFTTRTTWEAQWMHEANTAKGAPSCVPALSVHDLERIGFN